MRYMISTVGDRDSIHERPAEWIERWVAFTLEFNDELAETGELLQAESLDEAQHAVVVAPGGETRPGPSSDPTTTLLDFWIVGVHERQRAIELAARIATALGGPVEVRRLLDDSSIAP